MKIYTYETEFGIREVRVSPPLAAWHGGATVVLWVGGCLEVWVGSGFKRLRRIA